METMVRVELEDTRRTAGASPTGSVRRDTSPRSVTWITPGSARTGRC